MERIVDKVIALACCVPALALAGTGFAATGALLAAVTCAFLAELLPKRARIAPVTLYCVLACVLPAGSVFTAPAAYDLARVSPAASFAAAAPTTMALLTGAVDPGAGACGLLACAIAVALSLRTESTLRARSQTLLRADKLRERELALEAKNRELLNAQDYEVRLATLNERARIAREIHDNVGHLLTRATVQVEAFRVVHTGEPVEQDLAAVADTLHEALDVLGLDRLGISSSVNVEAGEAPAAIAGCLTAVVREAVSNVLRHSNANRVAVELVEHPGFWRLTIVANGTGTAPDDTAGGMGLASMEERVRALGGTFHAGPGQHGGWTVFASIPRPERRPA